MLPLPASVDIDVCQALFTEVEELLAQIEQPPSFPIIFQACERFFANAQQLVLEDALAKVKHIRDNGLGKAEGFPPINLLSVFGISRKESAHSRFLGWLLNPEETHGLGDLFLRKFLEIAQKACGKAFDFSTSDVTIYLERSGEQGTPDITIRGCDFECVVENKVMAAEGQDQTKRYASDAEKRIQNGNITADRLLLVFLTPDGHDPKDTRFKPMSYPELLGLLCDILETPMQEETRSVIEQFVFNLRLNVLHEFDLQKRITHFLGEYESFGNQYLLTNWQELWELHSALMQRRQK